jgi:hypothetical protein
MNIYQAITAAMADVEPIAKGRVNKEQWFNFRGIDEVMNELQPILKKHGLFVVPKVVDVIRQEKPTKSGGMLLYSIVTMEYTMYAQDGSSITGSTVGEGMDSGDKASNKAMAVALKYFLLQTFCIPTEDAKDPDADSHTVAATSAPLSKPEHVPVDPDRERCIKAYNILKMTPEQLVEAKEKHGGSYKKTAEYLEGLIADKEAQEAQNV